MNLSWVVIEIYENDIITMVLSPLVLKGVINLEIINAKYFLIFIFSTLYPIVFSYQNP